MKKMVNGVEVDLTPEEIEEFKAREAEHAAKLIEDAKIEYRLKRKSEYPPIEDVVVALLEAYQEGRPEMLKNIMAKRMDIKKKYPKP
jgi:muconolactone delta-isomerase